MNGSGMKFSCRERQDDSDIRGQGGFPRCATRQLHQQGAWLIDVGQGYKLETFGMGRPTGASETPAVDGLSVFDSPQS